MVNGALVSAVSTPTAVSVSFLSPYSQQRGMGILGNNSSELRSTQTLGREEPHSSLLNVLNTSLITIKKNSEYLARVEMLTLSHVNPIANTSRQLLYTAVLQDSAQGHLFCALPSCNRCEK